jgi:hypothetical protein
MKKTGLLFCLILFSTFAVNAESIMICGKYKLKGYYDDGSKYESTLILKKTDKGVVASGAFDCYLTEESGTWISEPDMVVKYIGFIDSYGKRNIPSTDFVNISFYKNGSVKVEISGINEIKCTRIS